LPLCPRARRGNGGVEGPFPASGRDRTTGASAGLDRIVRAAAARGSGGVGAGARGHGNCHGEVLGEIGRRVVYPLARRGRRLAVAEFARTQVIASNLNSGEFGYGEHEAGRTSGKV